MTPRQARRERREAERKAKELDLKKAPASQAPNLVQPRWNPELEDEFPCELQIRANALPDPVSAQVQASPVAPRLAQPVVHPTPEPIGFVSQTTPIANPKCAEINRANAQHSTGPCTPAGKLASSRNSLKHGLASGTLIIPGEDQDAFDAFLSGLKDEHQPVTPTEHLLIKKMAQSYWLSQRAIRLQN